MRIRQNVGILLTAALTVGLVGCGGNNGSNSTSSSNNSGNASSNAANSTNTTNSANTSNSTNSSNNGGTSNTSSEEVGTVDNLKITAFNWGWDNADPAKDVVLPELKKRLGLKDLTYDVIKTGGYDDVVQKLQLWASTGGSDWPDIVTTGSDSRTKLILNNLGESGKLEDLTPWLEKYPNVKNAVEKLLPFTSDPHDGKIYSIAQNFSNMQAYAIDQPTIWIRKDWLDKLNLPLPKTVDDLYNDLKAFKEQIKDVNGQPVIPYAAFGENFRNMIKLFFPPDQNDGTGVWYTDANGKPARSDVSQSDNLIRALTFYNKLYNEGLIEKEAFTLKQGQIDEKGNQGRYGAVHGAYWEQANPFTDSMKKTDPKAEFVGVQLYDPTIASGPSLPKFRLEAWSLWAVKAGLPKEEVNTFFKTLDYVLSEEGTILTKYGLEGQQWERNADGKIIDTKAFFDETQGDWNKRAHFGIDVYSFIPNYDALIKNQAPSGYELREDMIETWKNLGSKFPTEYVTDPQRYVEPGDVENKATVGQGERYKQLVAKAVTAKNPDGIKKLVEDWGKNVKALGYDKIVAEREEAAKSIHLENLK
ncbi:type 2 periplasmic-binding domain-containing protein [Paenibacillus albus]|uniref:Extracellular solute-binding protein n=1 Tax=Paenibacillus albus TaxID=2495582 RepID=A0A3S9A1Z0_9BACL|nr:extracellular solute-binding protein [Paenibacillus albus]AZN39706.1 extracellular solute-binding protein [Paenibacillus albus]